MTSDYKLSIPLNFCWAKQWHMGVAIVVLINIFAPWGAYDSYFYNIDFDKKYHDPNFTMQASWQTSCCMSVRDISEKQWEAFGLLITGVIFTDVITWLFVNDRFHLIEFKIKECKGDND